MASKTFRLKKHMIDSLSDGPKSTSDIIDYVNGKLKHGTMSHAVGNVLGKDPRFREKERGSRRHGDGEGSKSWTVTIWELVPEEADA